jgi:hypothetical protein
MDTFNSSKKSAFTTEVKQVYKVAEQTWMSDNMFTTKERVYMKCNGCSGEELDLSGRTNIDYYIRVNKSGKVVEYYITDGDYQFELEGNMTADDIDDVKVVADLSDDEILNIDEEGAYHGTDSSCKYKIVTALGSFATDSNVREICAKVVNDGYTYINTTTYITMGARSSGANNLIVTLNPSLMTSSSYFRVYEDSSKTKLLAEYTASDKKDSSRLNLNRLSDYRYAGTRVAKMIGPYNFNEVYFDVSSDFCRNNCNPGQIQYSTGYVNQLTTQTFTGPWIKDQDTINSLNILHDSLEGNRYEFGSLVKCSEYGGYSDDGDFYNGVPCDKNTYYVRYNDTTRK